MIDRILEFSVKQRMLVVLATMWMAVAADMGASLLLVANGLRLLRLQPVSTENKAL